MEGKSPHVALFVTCLIDAWRPVVGFAAVKLLEEAGCRVTVPPQQTCCGQPAMNSGDKNDAKRVARGVIEVFSPFDYVVVPSGSCAGTISRHYPELFQDEPAWLDRAKQLAARTFELTSFLVDILAELKEPETCCGFGGLFCVKYPDISEKMVQAKVDDIVATGADTVLGGDLGCLLNIAGRLSRQGHTVHVRHVAEVLSGLAETAPPIGETP